MTSAKRAPRRGGRPRLPSSLSGRHSCAVLSMSVHVSVRLRPTGQSHLAEKSFRLCCAPGDDGWRGCPQRLARTRVPGADFGWNRLGRLQRLVGACTVCVGGVAGGPPAASLSALVAAEHASLGARLQERRQPGAGGLARCSPPICPFSTWRMLPWNRRTARWPVGTARRRRRSAPRRDNDLLGCGSGAGRICVGEIWRLRPPVAQGGRLPAGHKLMSRSVALRSRHPLLPYPQPNLGAGPRRSA